VPALTERRLAGSGRERETCLALSLSPQSSSRLASRTSRHLDRAGRMPAALQGYAPPLGVRSGENRAARQTVGGVSGSKKGVAAVDVRDVRHGAPFLPEPIVRAAAVFFHRACCGKLPDDRSKRMRSRPHTGSTTRSLPPECHRPKWATYGRKENGSSGVSLVKKLPFVPPQPLTATDPTHPRCWLRPAGGPHDLLRCPPGQPGAHRMALGRRRRRGSRPWSMSSPRGSSPGKPDCSMSTEPAYWLPETKVIGFCP